MTTGNRSTDLRFSIDAWNGTKLSPRTIGRKYSKSWTGTDGKQSGTPVLRGIGRYSTRSQPKTIKLLPPQSYSTTISDESLGLHRVWLNDSGCSMLSLPKGAFVDTTVTNKGGIPNANPKLYFKLSDKVRRQVYGSEFAFLNTLIEGRQAVEMIGTAAERIGAAIWCLKRGNYRELAKALSLSPKVTKDRVNRVRGLSNKWLELSYGWLPLVQDAASGAQYLAQAVNGGTQPGKVKVSCKEVVNVKPPPWAFLQSNLTRFGTETCTTNAYLTVYVSKVSSAFTPNIWSVGGALWEGTPYSFVADWFVPVGSVLSALKTRADISGTYVYSLKRVFECTNPEISPLLTKLGAPILGYNRYVEIHFDRTVSKELVVPSLFSAVSGFGSSYMRTANAVSLIAQKDWKSLYRKWKA